MQFVSLLFFLPLVVGATLKDQIDINQIVSIDNVNVFGGDSNGVVGECRQFAFESGRVVRVHGHQGVRFPSKCVRGRTRGGAHAGGGRRATRPRKCLQLHPNDDAAFLQDMGLIGACLRNNTIFMHAGSLESAVPFAVSVNGGSFEVITRPSSADFSSGAGVSSRGEIVQVKLAERGP